MWMNFMTFTFQLTQKFNTMSNWSSFYQTRVNTTYQNYFEKKYRPLLEMLQGFKNVREEGIGIGSVSKYLIKQGVKTAGFDLCPEMVRLCKTNNPTIECYVGNIFENQNDVVDIVVTHGVLEHFLDVDIKFILNRYKGEGCSSVHYVPLNGYDKPSFGDERLLPWQHWVDTFNPTKFKVVNNKDLYMLFK